MYREKNDEYRSSRSLTQEFRKEGVGPAYYSPKLQGKDSNSPIKIPPNFKLSKIPFGSGVDRFGDDYLASFMSTPGPGSYSNNPNMSITKLRQAKNALNLSHSRTSEIKHRNILRSDSPDSYNDSFAYTSGSFHNNDFKHSRLRKKGFKNNYNRN